VNGSQFHWRMNDAPSSESHDSVHGSGLNGIYIYGASGFQLIGTGVNGNQYLVKNGAEYRSGVFPTDTVTLLKLGASYATDGITYMAFGHPDKRHLHQSLMGILI